jgi:type II secretory pathway pseudopilin PulG
MKKKSNIHICSLFTVHCSLFRFTVHCSLPAFTLVELLVVLGMIAILIGAMTTSVTAARRRARIQKATSDVKVISQAILAYENYNKSGDSRTLPTLNRAVANKSNLGFLLGKDTTETGDKLPVLIQAAMSSGGEILDPWGHPYKVTIKEGNLNLSLKTVNGNLSTGYYLPNIYRLSEDER